MLTLGLETSCDETSASVVKDGRRILSNVISSSQEFHKKYGGVIPEIASRLQIELINYVVKRALSRVPLDKIDLIAVTAGPGLAGSLLVGISFAKALSFSRGIPCVGVNHLKAHLYANFFNKRPPAFPFVGLLISGGHTALVYVSGFDEFELLGQTRDDAAGEAFDKVAKILSLGYPGGPIIDEISRGVNPGKVKFTRPYLKKDSLDFSFSGIKTQVLYYVRDRFPQPAGPQAANGHGRKDVAAGFQEAVVEVLVNKAMLACRRREVKQIVLGGGVSRNTRLRRALSSQAKTQGIEVFCPAPVLCTDNAAMVAGLGYRLYKEGKVADLRLTACPAMTIEEGGN